jgi:A/G-specific adenine glycosylase
MASLEKRLYIWYELNHRDLPWRKSIDPYKIWVSEIILHQTRVKQGLAYYHRFVEAFPTQATLARATIDAVLHVWEGLGYYRRAIHMHQAAGVIMREHGGKMPVDYQSLIALPGIGDYTASLISSVFNEEHRPAVDGNVVRFISRLFDLPGDPSTTSGKREIVRNASLFMGQHPPGIVNSALMEFGALQCVLANPNCSLCPFTECLARERGRIQLLPIKKRAVKVQSRSLHYLVIQWHEADQHILLIRKRGDRDIWAHLHDFPSAEITTKPQELHEIAMGMKEICEIPAGTMLQQTYGTYQHLLTHQKITAWFHHLWLPTPPAWFNPELLATSATKLGLLGKPQLIARHLKDIGQSL